MADNITSIFDVDEDVVIRLGIRGFPYNKYKIFQALGKAYSRADRYDTCKWNAYKRKGLSDKDAALLCLNQPYTSYKHVPRLIVEHFDFYTATEDEFLLIEKLRRERVEKALFLQSYLRNELPDNAVFKRKDCIDYNRVSKLEDKLHERDIEIARLRSEVSDLKLMIKNIACDLMRISRELSSISI